jgi:hypothetical protein
MPAPKSAWNPLLAPIVVTIDAEFDSTGSVSTGVFQMLLDGSTWQPPMVCCAWAAPAPTTLDASARTTQRARMHVVNVEAMRWRVAIGMPHRLDLPQGHGANHRARALTAFDAEGQN